jgi:hypothetical protein
VLAYYKFGICNPILINIRVRKKPLHDGEVLNKSILIYFTGIGVPTG